MRQALNQIGNTGLLSPFAASRFKGNLADARENAVPIKATAGNPQGELAVQGTRGKFWATRYLPGNQKSVLIFDAATHTDGTPKDDFEIGQTVYLKRLSDTQPTNWVLDTKQASDRLGFAFTVESSPGSCSGIDAAPSAFEGLVDSSNWPASNTVPDDSPFKHITMAVGTSIFCATLDGVKTGHRAKSEPLRSKQPPLYAENGDVWQDSNDESVYRRQSNGNYRPVNGPSSGTFLMRKTTDTLTKGKLVYDSNLGAGTLSTGQVSMASNSNSAVLGKLAGFAAQDRNSGEFVTVQQSGEFDYTHGQTPGTPLFLGTSGNLTATPPAAGSGLIWQQVAIAGQANTIVIDIRTPIQR